VLDSGHRVRPTHLSQTPIIKFPKLGEAGIVENGAGAPYTDFSFQFEKTSMVIKMNIIMPTITPQGIFDCCRERTSSG